VPTTTATVGQTALPLDDLDCRALLRAATVGRVGLSIEALPVVLPVTYAVDGDRIVFRTGRGAKLAQALQRAVVCFEVDDVDVVNQTGWSVLVTGQASAITEPADLERARSLMLNPWRDVDGEHYVAITIELLSGRRFAAA
jgi:nitroimidazol reductase NimA-like FMN-containing flavoprotein (pyridoxamine 5'-phosphate oxidase superfamily)